MGDPVRLSRWKKVAFAIVMVAALLGLLELVLVIVGLEPGRRLEDPFVGFVSDMPLFVERAGDERDVLTTAGNKGGFFNKQSFPGEKPEDTYRIFCLGGSTTYGRPYSDETSFSRWLRELLPVADPGRRWEVINAGGISYASYRVAHVMEELAGYQPDLFVVYTGHNEFLEERTYGDLRDMPGIARGAASLLARTRTWTLLSSAVEGLGSTSRSDPDERSILPDQVQAKLDHSAGLTLYERDDALRDGILAHYRLSLERMVDIARSAGADIVFVVPASNLKNFSPFKSQHTDGLDDAGRARSAELLKGAEEHIGDSRWEQALALLDEALAADPRSADLHYRRGEVLLALGRADEAESAFVTARDEDVCPLRALTAMQEIVAEVAREAAVPVVDYPALLSDRTRRDLGHGIAGEELFLDHVHPTIEGHRLLAVALIDAMGEAGTVSPGPAWGEAAIAEVAARVEGGLDRGLHARALANLALTLDWAGKRDVSRRLAFQALESGAEDPTILMMVARHYALERKTDEALEYFRRAVRANPGNPVIHSQLGMMLAGIQAREAAAAHFYLASLLAKGNETYHQQLASIMATRGRAAVALASLEQARRLNPGNQRITSRIASLRAQLGRDDGEIVLPEFSVTRYESGYPRTIAQSLPGPDGRPVIHGIWTEWYDGGGLKGFVDYEDGVPHGVAVTWDQDGRVVSRTEYRRGVARPATES